MMGGLRRAKVPLEASVRCAGGRDGAKQGVLAMIGASLVVLVTLGQSPTSDPSTLVPLLGAPRYSQREAAAGELEKFGRRALPALRTARETKDPEVQTRASALIDKIEGSLLTQPTMLRLDFENRPLPEVVKDLGEQAGIKLALLPENSPHWPTRRLTIHEPAPLPFWKAIDRVCEAGRLQYNLGMNGLPSGREPIFPLFEGGMRPTSPTVDTGPFRVCLVGLHYQRDFNFQPVPVGGGNMPIPPSLPPNGSRAVRPGLATSDQFYAQLQVFGEPRLTLSQNGPLKIVEAVDDKGQALTSALDRGPLAQRTSSYFGYAAGSVVQFQAAMSRPEQPGKTIRKLRGVLPLSVSTRKPNPLVVKLAGSSGRTFRNEELALTLHEVRPVGNSRQTLIELSIRRLSGTSGGLNSGAAQPEFVVQRPDTFQQQIEVSDAQGRPIPWYQTNFDAEASKLTLTVTPQNLEANVGPVELRFYGMARSSTEITFEFNDLPLP